MFCKCCCTRFAKARTCSPRIARPIVSDARIGLSKRGMITTGNDTPSSVQSGRVRLPSLQGRLIDQLDAGLLSVLEKVRGIREILQVWIFLAGFVPLEISTGRGVVA